MNDSIDTDQLRARNLRTVAALAGLFLLPLIASFILYYGLHWAPAGTTNHGELLRPVRPLPDVVLPDMDGRFVTGTFRNHWTLLYVDDGRCRQACRDSLIFMRQTWLSLNRDTTRVQRVLLVTSGLVDRVYLLREHPGLVVLDVSGERAQSLLAQFPQDQRDHALFVVDPLGNLMMRYDARLAPQGLLSDLRQLLRLSHIG